MVPIYAINSFLSLCFIQYAPIFDVPRDVYESYVLYNFVALLIDYMGGENEAKAFFAAQPPQKHWWPFHWLGDHDMSVFLETTRLVCPAVFHRKARDGVHDAISVFQWRLGRHGLACHRGESLDHAREQRFRYTRVLLPGLLLSCHTAL